MCRAAKRGIIRGLRGCSQKDEFQLSRFIAKHGDTEARRTHFASRAWGREWSSFPRGRWIAVATSIAGLGIALLANDAVARERAVVARLETGLTVVPFAVPVATPVAVLQPGGVAYSYSPSPSSGNAAGGAAHDAKLREEFEAFRRWRQAQQAPADETAAATDAESKRAQVDVTPLVAANCLACHRGEQAKGGVRLDGSPSSARRLAAIRAVLSGEMPKGRTLAAEDVGELLFELSDGSASMSSVKGE